MRILILEDETLASEKVETLLKEIDPSIQVLDKLKSVEAAVAWYEANDHPDLVISDIRLLDGLSFEIFERVGYKGPVIFTTAYDQYAIKAFEVNSIDYLLKPIQSEKLAISIKKYEELSFRDATPGYQYEELVQMLTAGRANYKSRFMIKAGNKILAVPIEKVAYFYSQNKLTYIVTSDNKKYPFDQPLEIIDQQVDPQLFFRANRKYIVRFEAIEEIHPYFKGRIKLNLTPESEDEIVISSDKTPEFKKWLDQ